MQVHLPAEMEAFINGLVEHGRYGSADEAIVFALDLLRDQEDLVEIKRERLRKLVTAGAEQLERGEFIEGELVFSRINERIQHELGKKVS